MESLSPARDYFDEVRNAALELERTTMQLEALRLHATDSGDQFAPKVSATPNDIDGSSKIASRMDRRAQLEERHRRYSRVLQAAWNVVYENNGGGIARGVSDQVADAVWMRSIMGCKWQAVAAELMCSVPTAQGLYDAAMDYLDSVGLERSGIPIVSQL